MARSPLLRKLPMGVVLATTLIVLLLSLLAVPLACGTDLDCRPNNGVITIKTNTVRISQLTSTTANG